MTFKGTYTAMVTPFNANGAVDYGKLRELVEEQIAGGVDGLVPVGTSGESPTLSMEEHSRVVEFVAETANRRVQIVAGTGANSTAEALRLTREALEMGVDASLQVCPYYNKPNQEGLYRHFSAIADLGLPIILYNVPSRTGRDIALETVVRLSKHPNVAAVKEASGSVARVSATVDACDITVLSGDDVLAFPMIAVGAKGVISVASNVAPGLVSKMINAALSGDMVGAATLHKRLYHLFRDLFIDTNPIPVKCALALMGRIEEVYRLPLCETSDACRAQIRATLAELKLV
ncbi:MAG: 4-hydroxy-tetrahydrodipicolinate synthase [Kiritimatiellae bacterium]|nr:4-hydroxy-tetrahydrodipicolinate synthase [Kiritimatiellia bacterium]